MKAAILTAAVLRKNAEDDQNRIKTFKKIHVQQVKLSKLGEFSKNNSGIRKFIGYGTKAGIDSSVKANTDSLQFSFVVKIQKIGDILVTVTKQTGVGSPFFGEGGKSITLKFALPVYAAGVFGKAIIREKLKRVFKGISNKGIPLNLEDFTAISEAFGITKGVDTAGNIITEASPVGVSACGNSVFTFVWNYVAPLDTSDVVPLPGQKLLTNEKGRWVLDFTTVSSTLNGTAEASSDIAELPIAVKLSASMGKVAKLTGADTLHDLLSKIDALLLGKVDSKSGESTAVSSLLKGQAGQILKIFRGIAKMNTNAAFELQMLYNDLLKNTKTEAEREEIKQLFTDFIDASHKIAPATVEETQLNSGEAEAAELSGEEETSEEAVDGKEYEAALDSFKQIVDKQYVSVFKPYYDNAFAGSMGKKIGKMISKTQETEADTGDELKTRKAASKVS